MWGTVMDIRKHVVFDDCGRKVKEYCYNKFREECVKLDDIRKQNAQDRLDRELEIVENNGFYYEFYLMKLITEKALESKRLVVIGERIVYSYIAYLMGISDIDPTGMNYPMEMLYSIGMNKSPEVITANVPSGYSTILVEYLNFLFGADLVNIKGKYVVLGDAKYSIDIDIRETQIITCADAMLSEECVNDLPEMFYKKRALIFKEKQNYQDKEYVFEATTKQFTDLLHVVATIQGTDVWAANKRAGNGNLFFTCDDVYRYGQELFRDRDLAFKLMENVRKGKGGSESIQSLLKEYRAGENTCEQLGKIKYLRSEGACLLDAQIIHFLIRNISQYTINTLA